MDKPPPIIRICMIGSGRKASPRRASDNPFDPKQIAEGLSAVLVR